MFTSIVRRLLVVLLAVLLVLSVAPARAQDDENGADPAYSEDSGPPPGYDASGPDPADYEDTLHPYGEWVDDDQYGHVWRPTVVGGWQPYSVGHWVWSPYGWTWISAEPWGWTFHYGRWAFAPAFGWVWVPGTVWGPAWVDWYWGDGFVGWAPLPPFAFHVAVVDEFLFVSEAHFCAPHVHTFIHGFHGVPGGVIHDFHRHVGQPPLRDRIERVAAHPVPRIDRRPPETVAPHLPRAARLSPPAATPRLHDAPPSRRPSPFPTSSAAGVSPRDRWPRPQRPSVVPSGPGPRPMPPPVVRAHPIPRPASGWRGPTPRPPTVVERSGPPRSTGFAAPGGGGSPGITNTPPPGQSGAHAVHGSHGHHPGQQPR